MPIEMPRCWCCQHKTIDMVSIDGSDISETGGQVCLSCWNKIPEYWQVMINLVCRNRQDGGIGARELFENSEAEWLHDLLNKRSQN